MLVNGRYVSIDGIYTPVLGRDVLDHFAAIFDRWQDRILLVAEPDSYQVLRAS